jgi:putative cell wall-binding protein
VTEVPIAGGPAAVPEAVADELADEGPMVRRLYGADRFGTSVALADDLAGHLGDRGDDELWVATGWSYADAIAAAPTVARQGGTLVLIDGSANEGDGELDPLIERLAGSVEALDVLGGTAAVQDAAVLGVQERLQD